MALDYILGSGGVGYLPSPVVAQSVDDGLLHVVEGAPVMEQSLYLISREDNEKAEMIEAMLAVPFNNVIESV